MSPRVERLLPSLGRALVRGRWPILLFLAALVVRLHWNLVVHPAGDYIYSDMNGYLQRATSLFGEWKPREYHGFYPYGTHVLLFVVLRVFGLQALPEAAAVWAVIGAAVVPYAWALARRVSRFPVVAHAIGIALVFYYPLVSLGGYFLSEVPFSLCVVASTFHVVRLVDEGRGRDAWIAGVWVAAAATLRPQILLSVAFFLPWWILVRRQVPKLGSRMLLRMGVPLLLVLAFSAARLHWHTGRYGLISENGPFNEVFGRCHVTKITALPDQPGRVRTSFGPPPMIQLSKRTQKNPGEWPQLDPAIGPHLEYEGYIGDQDRHRAWVRECIAKTGWVKQAEYALVGMFMLWRFNIVWPDSGKKQWQDHMHWWGRGIASVVAIPALLALLAWARPRRAPKLALLGCHLLAVSGVAAIYFGDTRLRVPYDPVLLLMAAETVAFGAVVVGALAVKWRNRRNAPGVESVAPDTAGPPPHP